MIEKFQKAHLGLQNRPILGLSSFYAPHDSDIVTIIIWATVNFQTAIFNVRVNGSPLFAGGSRPEILAGGDAFVEVTGLSEAVLRGDLITIDIEDSPQGGVSNIVWQVEFEDGGIRNLDTITTSSLADEAEDTGEVEIARTSLVKHIEVSDDCRVRMYKTAAHRTADAARDFGDISFNGTDHGIILDILFDGVTEWELSPEAICSNGDDPITRDIYWAVQNLSGGTTTIDVDVKVGVLIL